MKTILTVICAITLLTTSGCLVSDREGGHREHEHGRVIVGPPVVVVPAPEVIVRPPEVIVR